MNNDLITLTLLNLNIWIIVIMSLVLYKLMRSIDDRKDNI